jgi:hypothetical protein
MSITLTDLLARGIRPRRYESLAIAQQLITAGIGAPNTDNIRLNTDGSVQCLSTSQTLEVRDIAALLHALLPADDVPAPLRRGITRALGGSDEPAFASLQEFSNLLVPFEGADRRGIVRALLQRAKLATTLSPARAVSAPASAPPVIAPTPVRPVTAPAPDRVVATVAPMPPVAPRAPRPHAAAPAPPAGPALKHRKSHLAVVAAVVFAGFIVSAVMLRQDPASSAAPPLTNGPAITDAPGQVLDEPQPVSTSTEPLSEIPDESGTPVAALASRTAFSPSFAPRGGPLFFHTGGARDATSAIAMTSASGGDGRVVPVIDDGARNYHPQASPDGRLIAFDSDKDGERAIYVASADGKDVRRISGPGYAAVPSWSPDGTRLTYIRAEPGRPRVWNLWVQSVDEGTARRVTSHASGQTWAASWFPDNRRIAYSHEDQLVVTDLSTGKSTQFRSPVAGRLVRTPAVSPSGSKVVFQVFRNGVWMLDVATGAISRVLSDPVAEEFAWSPDGRRIAFHTRRNGVWSIYLMPGA